MHYTMVVGIVCMHSLTHRVVWVFGGAVRGPITEITPTHLTTDVLATLCRVDDIAQTALATNGAPLYSKELFP